MKEHLPLLNIGFSNRRRFLATDNQSDKMGSKMGDTWLYFEADSFGAALVQAPKQEHWHVKRCSPPRLAPDQEGYYYNFEHDVIADDSCYIMMATHKQQALSILQKSIRGAICRRRIGKETAAAVVIQKTKMMWDCQRVYGNQGKNANILKGWYRKYKARLDKIKIDANISRLQAVFQGRKARRFTTKKMAVLCCFQASFRGLRGRRRYDVLVNAASTIQRFFRGHYQGRQPLSKKHLMAAKIQAMARGSARRSHVKVLSKACIRIQSHWRGYWMRKQVAHLHACGLKIQVNWYRFRAQVYVKQELFRRMHEIYEKRADILRSKVSTAAAQIMQRNYRRARDFQKYVYMKRERGDADKRTQTLIVAMFLAVGSLRTTVHPWWRHLPLDPGSP